MTWAEVALWVVLPYLTLVILVGGLIWRYKYDRFGWTTRSSQLYESRMLRIGSPLFHFGLLFVILGHVVGLLIPESWTAAVGVSDSLYHVNALIVGGIAGFCTLAGIALLIYRRRTTGPVFMATTRNDKLMYVVLVAAIVAGLVTTVYSTVSPGTDYRQTVSPWFRGVFVLQPDAVAMTRADWTFKLHAVIGMLLFALFPFTRLVHAFSAPIGYLFRPYIVYRSRD
ncbi:respiratory nitrate reductase subunit gamma [Nonomuraea sp. NPDC046570]|uniref:respiratory nitrate reductase subunit gamma n=1 Tax=Nonomuraea sp. NPDC046570 TaxID=3155255 RepID=UPI003406479E